MAVANTTALNLLGKYVSFSSQAYSDHYGVVSSVVFQIDGSVQFSIGWDDFYNYSEVIDLKVIGEVTIY
jgi:hypothetical protein